MGTGVILTGPEKLGEELYQILILAPAVRSVMDSESIGVATEQVNSPLKRLNHLPSRGDPDRRRMSCAVILSRSRNTKCRTIAQLRNGFCGGP